MLKYFNIMKIRNSLASIFRILVLLFICKTCFCQIYRSTLAYDSYFMKTGSYPEDATHDWNPKGTESQGVTHDNDNWYFTSTDYDGGNAHLWRIPVSVPLNRNVRNFPGVLVTSMTEIPQLQQAGYWHWGDPDHYEFNGVDYILVPVTSNRGFPPAIAVFRGGGLEFLTYGNFPSNESPANIGWCAISQAGDLYTSEDNACQFLCYSIDWSMLQSGNPKLVMTFNNSIFFKTENGIPFYYESPLYNMQGGEFTPDGKLLYISCGSGQCASFGHGRYSTDGIHVFETSNWNQIMRSINSERGQHGFFNFSFNNGCTCLTGSQTPEGLTIWDLDYGRAPFITGQLHVLKNFYNRYAVCDDALSLQHFRRISAFKQ